MMKPVNNENKHLLMNPGSGEKGNQSMDHMMTGRLNDRIHFSNMILIAGDRRNVGKTSFSMKIIRKLSVEAEVIGIKTTPHRHLLTEGLEIVIMTNYFMIAIEKGVHYKDSALLRQAGASKVFLIMAKQQHLCQAFFYISKHISGKLCVVESGGLAAYVQPAIFFFITNPGEEIQKKQYLTFDPVIIMNTEFDSAIEKLEVENNKLIIYN